MDRYDKDGKLTREGAEEAIRTGGSVLLTDKDKNRRVVTRTDDLDEYYGPKKKTAKQDDK